MWHKVIVMIVTLEVTNLQTCTSEPHGGINKWQRPTLISQDYNNGFLIGIEQRLRGLDTIRHTVSRTDVSIQSLSTRMELIETRLQTVQSSLQHTLDAVSTAVKSSEMKYELLLEQISRKVEAGFDRMNHRLNTVESRNEAMINKLQNQMDLLFGRVESKQNTLGNDIIRIGSNIDVIRSHILKQEDNNNQTLHILVKHFQEIHVEQGVKKEHLKNITSLLSNLHSNRSESFTQNDAPILPQESLKLIKSEIIDEGHKISAKIHNMYNDLWRTVKDLEVLIRSGFEETNKTNIGLYNRLTDMLEEEQRHTENFMDLVMRGVLTNVGDILSDLRMQVDSRFKEFKSSQEKHGESCHKIKSVIENRIALILEKIYDTFDNRTDKFSKEILDVAELLKAHNKQLIQSTTHTNNILVTLAEEISQDHKQLDSSITYVSDNCQDLQKETEEINNLYMKNYGTIREIKSLLLSMKNKNYITNSTNAINENLHAIEANFSNGVIKIKTTPSNPEATGQEEAEQKFPLETLNKSISTTDLIAVIGESRSKNDDEDFQETKTDLDEDDDFDAQEETGMDEWKPIDATQLLLAYIKVLHGNLTPSEFLAEAVPGNSYETFDDMIKHLRKADNVPRETIHDIQQLAQEQNYKDSIQPDSIGSIIKRFQQNRDSDSEDESYDDED